MGEYILAYDEGTTGMKTCLYRMKEKLVLEDAPTRSYPLYMVENGGAEQEPDDLWEAVCKTTKDVLLRTAVSPGEIAGLTFCAQMQGLILVDTQGMPIHRCMNYMDQRATEEFRRGIGHGLRIAGLNIRKLICSLFLRGPWLEA